nr:hypothetical protein [Tanacetum cinerariifolium]
MLAPGNYVQWKSKIKRYIGTKPNQELIHYCLTNPPYELGWKEKFVLDSDRNPTTTTERVFETYKNVKQDIRDQLNAEAKAVHIILTEIDNDIYSTVDACPNVCEMWKAIERLKQGESINVQDLETNLFWEFRKFTSQDGESLELYYSRCYKIMNELIRNQCKVTNHQVNVQFLLQLQPEWQRFVTLVKQSQELKNVSYHKLYDILKQHQHEVNKIRAEKIARVANSLVLVAQQQPDNSPWIHRNAGYGHQRLGNVAGARETVGSTVVQKSRIQCYNYKEYGHVARECQKPKRAKDAAYHRKKMLLCKQEEAGIQLNEEQADWKDDTDDESDDQELEAHYMYMAKLQQVSPDAVDSGPIFDTEPEQKVQNDDQYDVFAIECQHPEQSESIHKTYLIEQDAHNVIIELEDMNYDSKQFEQNDEDADLAKERELLASLIEKLKCEIDETKNHFKNKNKSLTEANNKLSKENDLLYVDFKKSKAELKRRDSIEYASEMKLECAKVRGCYNDNLALMLAPESDEVIRLEKESRSKLSDLIKPFDYTKLNSLYDLFVPQCEKSSEQRKINVGLHLFLKRLNEEMVVDLKYFNSLELEVDSLTSQLETQKTQFVNEIDRLSREYYYADHMNAILGVYTELDEVTNLQCDYLELLQKCECLETELSKNKMMSKSFESVQKSCN